MSVIGHLEALRRALIISGTAWLVLSVASWFLTVDILQLLQHRAQLDSSVPLVVFYLGSTALLKVSGK